MLNRWKVTRNIVALYPAGTRIFIIKVNRRGRRWNLSSFDTVSSGGSGDTWTDVTDVITRILPGISDPKKVSLTLILPRSDYFFTRGIYPKHLVENIANILNYEKSDHVFLKEDYSVITGDIIETQSSLIATIYWVKNSVWETLWQGGIVKSFGSFLVIPDLMVLSKGIYSSFIAEDSYEVKGTWVVFPIGKNFIHSFHITQEGSITESVLIDPRRGFLGSLVSKKLQNSSTILYSDSVSEGFIKDSGIILNGQRLLFTPLEEIVRHGILGLLDVPTIHGFNDSIRTNLPKVPVWGYIFLAIFMSYALFAGYILFEGKHLEGKLARIKKERVILEEQWKPIEQQLNLVKQIEQDKENLEAITAQTIPLREFMELLSITTPKDTWLNNLILTQGNKIILRGDSKSAVQYMGELSKIPGFKDVKFISPVRKDAGSDKEFFNIEITVDWSEFKKSRSK
ncbi:MAG: PilN domain-containing protein [Syntrophobacterales bacterium]|nr:PilN domain-containing protein [Syntrophobacterales bacterium]